MSMKYGLCLLVPILSCLWLVPFGCAQDTKDSLGAMKLPIESEQLKTKKLNELCELNQKLTKAFQNRDVFVLLQSENEAKDNQTFLREINPLVQRAMTALDEWKGPLYVGDFSPYFLQTPVFPLNDAVNQKHITLRNQTRNVFKLLDNCIQVAHLNKNNTMAIQCYRHYSKFLDSIQNMDSLSYFVKSAAIVTLFKKTDDAYHLYSTKERKEILIQLGKMRNDMTLSLLEAFQYERCCLLTLLHNTEYYLDTETVDRVSQYISFLASMVTEKDLIETALRISDKEIAQTAKRLNNYLLQEDIPNPPKKTVSAEELTERINNVKFMVGNHSKHINTMDRIMTRYGQ